MKAIIFDLNGVFIKSEYFTSRIEKDWGIPIEESFPILKIALNEVRMDSSKKLFTFFQPILNKYGINITENEFLKYYFSGESLVKEMIDISNVLREKGYMVYIFSNNFKERTEYYRQYFKEIFNSVDGSFFSWETGFVKSDIKAYVYILEQIDLKPNQVIFFDDSEENIKMASSIGIKGYVFKDIEKTKEILEKELDIRL